MLRRTMKGDIAVGQQTTMVQTLLLQMPVFLVSKVIHLHDGFCLTGLITTTGDGPNLLVKWRFKK